MSGIILPPGYQNKKVNIIRQDKDDNCCDKIDCKKKARWKPILVIAANPMYMGVPPVEAEIELKVCDTHAIRNPDEFISDEAWGQIVDHFRDMNRIEPSREFLKIKFERLTR